MTEGDEGTIGVCEPRDVQSYRAAKALLTGQNAVTARFAREWILNTLVPKAVLRMAAMGFGELTFATPTPAGNVVMIEAPAAVQRAALHDLIAIGLPAQLGLVDDDGNALPGVIALGEFDMLAAQEIAHGPRLLAGASVGEAIAHELDGTLPAPSGSTYELPADHEIIVVEEGIGAEAKATDDHAPAPILPRVTPEKIALLKHRERMTRAKQRPIPAQPTTTSENGHGSNGNGHHGNGSHLRD